MIFARELIARRVPHYVAIYVGVCWGLVQFMTFLEERNGWSPHLTNLLLIGGALLIPSVALLAYNHGKPGADSTPRLEKAAFALNLIGAVALLIFLFHDKELGAVVTSVTTRDEASQTIERFVPKASFRKRLAIFNFDDPSGDTANSWLRYGLPLAVATDLTQDMFIDLRTSAHFQNKLQQHGFPDGVNVPLALKRRIATEHHVPYFTEGRLTRSGNQLRVEVGLYESVGGNLVQRHNYAGTDVFVIVDQITAGLKRDLEIPKTAKVPDLPVTEVLTASLPAFREFTDGVVAVQVKAQWPRAAAHTEEAVRLDPSFANAWLFLHNIYLNLNQTQKSMPPLQKALDHVYRLPERFQYDVKAEYYLMKQDKDRAYAVARTKVDLFPEDLSAYSLLYQLQMMRNDRDGMIATARKLLELDPSQQATLHQLGHLHEQKGDFANALRYYAQYAERFSHEPGIFLSLGNLQRLQSKHDQARSNFDRALAISPDPVGPLLALARLERDLGNFAAAEQHLNEALAATRTAGDSTEVLARLGDYHEFRGQLRQSLSYWEQSLPIHKRIRPPLNILVLSLLEVGSYMRAGKPDVARQTVRRVSAELKPPLHVFAEVGEAELQLELERPDLAEQALDRYAQSQQSFMYDYLQPRVLNARGRAAELRGRCEEAIRYYEELRRLQPTDVIAAVPIGRCYRKLGQAAKSMEHLQVTLRVIPFHARGNYELGLTYLETGDRTKAVEHLRRALQTWSAADPTYRYAAEARAKLAELTSN